MKSFRNFSISFLTAFCITALIFGTTAFIIVPKFRAKIFTLNSNDKQAAELVIGYEPIEDTPIGDADAGFSVLLVGTDKRPGVGKSKVDSLILAKICPQMNTVVYIPIPTNMVVTVDGDEDYLYNLRNTKGIEYLCEKVAGLTGLSVNYYAIASLTSFKNIIDDLGGIEFNVPGTISFSDPSEGLEINIAKGYQVLNGENAAKLLRYRSDGTNARMGRNVALMKTLLRKFTSEQYKDRAFEIYDTVLENTTTNFSQTDLAAHLDILYSYMKLTEVDIEYPGQFITEDDFEIFRPDTDQAIERLLQYK